MIPFIKKVIARLIQNRIDANCNRKLKKIRKNIGHLFFDKILEAEYVQIWQRLGCRPPKLFFRCINVISGIHSGLYVPENIQYGIIEPILNNKSYALVYNDKNFFERYLPKYKHLFPNSILRGINGVIHDVNFNRIAEPDIKIILNETKNDEIFILKPAIDTGGGSHVSMVVKKSGGFESEGRWISTDVLLKVINEKYLGSFVLQKKIRQHQWFANFNESSLNTVRLYTYRSIKDNSVHPLHAYVRIGNPGSLVDSSSQGGLTCGVSMNGILNDFAVERFGKRRQDLEGVRINGNTQVPFFSQMKEIAKEIAATYHYHRLLGFDFCVDADHNIRLMEINTRNVGIINQQMNTGPLYGEYTEEIVEYCFSQKRSVVLDFYV